MILLADIDAQGYVIIISSVFFGLSGLATTIIAYKMKKDTDAREDAKEERENMRAVKVEEVRLEQTRTTLKLEETRLENARLALDVKTTLHDANVKQNDKFDHLAKQVNGLKDELVKSVGDAAYAAGQKSQLEADKGQMP
jgi:hypothetical protein